MERDDLTSLGVIVARITITRLMTEDEVVDHIIAETPDGEEFPLAEALGMMRLAEHTLIEARTSAADD